MTQPKNAFKEWLETEIGKAAMSPLDFTKPNQLPYLENRLWWSYSAGVANTMERCSPSPGEWVSVKRVCYCGSLRVAGEAFKKVEYESVQKGEIALLPCCMYVDIQREFGAESDYKQKADWLHKRKIDICDEVFVLNVGGYIGESTRSEIDYAISIGKPVLYLEPTSQPPKE